jgi:2-polyprenyl-3-methyl-5-hydroxy-6-metoxy-1,4-benzoquinol methylase
MKVADIKAIAEKDAKARDYKPSRYGDWMEDILGQAVGLVLDLGAGDGAFTKPLLERGFRVISADVTHARLVRLRSANGLLVECDAANLPFKPGTFDTILFVEVLEHLPDRRTQADCIRGFAAALRRGGRMVLTTPNRPVYRVMLKLWEWFGGQKPDPTHFSELSLSELMGLMREECEIEHVRGKVGLMPVKVIQRFFARWPSLCYDILVVAKPRAGTPG